MEKNFRREPQKQPETVSKDKMKKEIEEDLINKLNEGISQEEIVNHLITPLKGYFQKEGLDEDEIRALAEIEDKKEFVSEILKIMDPVIDLSFSDPKAYENLQREAFVASIESTKLNEVLSYEFDENTGVVELHLAPSRQHGGYKEEMYKGLTELAKIMQENESMTVVEGISWFIETKTGRALVEGLGFDYEGTVDVDTRVGQRVEGDKPSGKISMKREKFIDKFLK